MSVSLILYSISDILGKKMSYMTTVYGLPQKSSIKSLFSGLYSFFFLNATVHRFFFFMKEVRLHHVWQEPQPMGRKCESVSKLNKSERIQYYIVRKMIQD